MKRYIALFYFQKKIAIPAIVISLASALVVPANMVLTAIGVTYLLIAPLLHYLAYEVGNPKEYYFYYNLGFSRRDLWLGTILSASIFSLILIIL